MLKLHWETPQDLPFPLAVPVRVQGKDVRVPMPNGKGELDIGDADYLVDPDLRLLMVRQRNRVR